MPMDINPEMLFSMNLAQMGGPMAAAMGGPMAGSMAAAMGAAMGMGLPDFGAGGAASGAMQLSIVHAPCRAPRAPLPTPL